MGSAAAAQIISASFQRGIISSTVKQVLNIALYDGSTRHPHRRPVFSLYLANESRGTGEI
jgi:hypothetical protein